MRITKGFIFILLFIVYLLAAAFMVDLYQSRDSATPLLVDNFEIQVPIVLPLLRGLPDDMAKEYLGELNVVHGAVSRILEPLAAYLNGSLPLPEVCNLFENGTEWIRSFPQLSPSGALQFLQCSSVNFILNNYTKATYPHHGIYQEFYSNVTLHFHCVKFHEMHFLEQNASRLNVALSSFPGSGTTWLRYLIEQATGLFTGSLECDISLKHVGHMGEGVWTNQVAAVRVNRAHLNSTGGKNNTIFANSFRICQNDSVQFDKVVIVMRNPYTAILSEYNRMVTLSHVEKLTLDHYRKFWYQNSGRRGGRRISSPGVLVTWVYRLCNLCTVIVSFTRGACYSWKGNFTVLFPCL